MARLTYEDRAVRGLAGKPGARDTGTAPARPKVDWLGKGSAGDADQAEAAREAALERESERLHKDLAKRGRQSMQTAKRQQRQPPAGKDAGGALAVLEDNPRTPLLGRLSGREKGTSKRAGGWAAKERRRAVRESGVPAAVASWSGIGYKVAGATIGLALLLLVVSGSGPGAVTGLGSMLARVVDLIISPVDPLAPGTVTSVVGGTDPYSAADTAVLNASPGFAPAGGHPGGPGLHVKPHRTRGGIPGHKPAGKRRPARVGG